jgi:ribosomal protein L3 glutamine methyltransferase
MGKRQQLLKQLHTVRDYVRWGTSQFTENRLFFGHGTDNAWDEACALVLHALSIPAELCDHVLDARLTDAEKNLVMVLFETRIKERIPLAYLTGSANFAGFSFKVDERVIIPRSPIAELVERGYAPWADPQAITRLLDLCTGSGCIGIASALYLPACAVDLVDISEDALAVAQHNIDAHEVATQVNAIQSDLFDAVPAGQRYDVIISNPPYVDKRDFDSMPAEYSHEPALALTAGDDGLDLAKRILAQANDYLQDDGVLIMEVGNSGEALQEQFPDVPFVWLEFERGGYGVFAITAAELAQYRAIFA